MTKRMGVLFLIVLIFLPGCNRVFVPTPISPVPSATMSPSDLNETPGASPIMTTAEVTLSPSPEETSPVAPLTIAGTVMDVSLSARVLLLTQPVEGLNSIALTEGTKILSENGDEIALHTITRGMQVQATGEIGSPGSLIATQVVLLEQ